MGSSPQRRRIRTASAVPDVYTRCIFPLAWLADMMREWASAEDTDLSAYWGRSALIIAHRRPCIAAIYVPEGLHPLSTEEAQWTAAEEPAVCGGSSTSLPPSERCIIL